MILLFRNLTELIILLEKYSKNQKIAYMLCNRKTVIYGGSRVPHRFGISLFEEHVFFTDWTKMAVIKANKFMETNPQVYHQSSLRPYGVTVYHALRQPYGKPPTLITLTG
jgi:low density lipoprotein-related protein 2